MKKYDEVSVVRQLNNVDAVIGINPASKVIKVAKNSAIGNGTSGKIDFLSHYCGYHIEIVDVIQQQKEHDEEIAAKKAAKKANWVNQLRGLGPNEQRTLLGIEKINEPVFDEQWIRTEDGVPLSEWNEPGTGPDSI